MRTFWSHWLARIQQNRRQLIALTLVIVFMGLVLYGYTLSMRAAFLRMLEEWRVVQLIPAEAPVLPPETKPEPAPVPSLAGQSPTEPVLSVPAFVETPLNLTELRLTWPMAGEVITPFGWHYSRTFADWRYHTGVDLRGEALEQPVWAAREGTVLQAGACAWYGQVILVQHEAGLQTLYGHLGETLVSPGQPVEAGQVIGHLGQVGPAEAAEGDNFLHFEVLVQGEPVNPLEFLSPR